MTARNYPELPAGSAVCYCTTCGETFSGEASFDKHRPGRELPVRCLTPAEMEAKNMARNKRGHWVTEAWVNAREVMAL